VVRGDHHHHAERHQQREQVILGLVDLAVGEIAAAVEQRDRGGEVDHQLQHVTQQIADEQVAEGEDHLPLHREDRDEGRGDQGRLCEQIGQVASNAAREGARQHDHQGHHGHEDLGRCGVEVGDDEIHLLTSP
jgi:uncharacterized membrane protein YkoI